ncbi:putative secondary metabolism biosynthetic enzyme [Neofusicoccum ribis]|uniref:Secondary metabolism biosynthetic enzyme n=1 Tax=Neofusicoccum ribis TaxID=45134 RepID=A0ABR3TDZ7_9PEZI
MSSQSTNNTAIWINSEAGLEVKQYDNLPEPKGEFTLVEVAYSGINPADVKHGRLLGIRNTVAGYDFSGTVVKAGPGSKHRVGDKIAGCTPSGIGRPAEYGTHQDYAIAPDGMTFAIPENLPVDHAGCLAVSVRTAADTIFNLLEYPLPDESSSDTRHPALLVWGGASSLGFMAIQFAKATGARPIFTTASPANHAALKDLGATECFDYKDPDVVSKIKKAASEYGVSLERIFDAVGSPEQRTADTAMQCGTESSIGVCSTNHPTLKMPVASLELPFTIQLPGMDKTVTIPARPEQAARVFKAINWAVRNYGAHFRIPTVEVFGGRIQECVAYLEAKAAQGSNFRKVCFQHPFKN